LNPFASISAFACSANFFKASLPPFAETTGEYIKSMAMLTSLAFAAAIILCKSELIIALESSARRIGKEKHNPSRIAAKRNGKIIS
jgi:hypothetical protein